MRNAWQKRTAAMRIAAMLLTVMLMNIAFPARAESTVLTCPEGRANCLLLQMTAAGDFSRMAPSDSLSLRVHAAILPMLQAVTEEDIAHFLAEHPMDEETLRRQLFAATGYALWADILTRPADGDERLDASRQVLLLFLRPAEGSRDVEDRATIRSMMTEELLAEMAEMNGVSTAFLEHVFYSDDWRAAEGT